MASSRGLCADHVLTDVRDPQASASLAAQAQSSSQSIDCYDVQGCATLLHVCWAAARACTTAAQVRLERVPQVALLQRAAVAVHAPELRLHVVIAERAAALVHRRAARATALRLPGPSQVAVGHNVACQEALSLHRISNVIVLHTRHCDRKVRTPL